MSRHNSQSQTVATAPKAETDGCCGTSAVAAPTHDAIAHRAYDIYLKSGKKQGQCKQNWQQAEDSLHEQCQAAPQAAVRSASVAASHVMAAR